MSELSLPFSSFLNDFEKDNNKVYNMLSSIDIEYSSLYQVNIIKKKRFNNNIIIKSNIEQLFNNQNYINNINGSSDKYNIDENNNLDQLININNANSILLIVNTTNERLIKDINEKFLELNYKNKNIHKKNKKKIYKIVAFESNNNLYNEWYSIYNLYKKTNYDSIIFYNISLPLTEEYEKILFKQPIIPIILTNNDNNIIIIQNKLLDNIIQNNSDIIHYQNSHNNIYFSNDLNKKIIFTNTNINNNIIKNELKYYDTVN
jgi:hypothetical protein